MEESRRTSLSKQRSQASRRSTDDNDYGPQTHLSAIFSESSSNTTSTAGGGGGMAKLGGALQKLACTSEPDVYIPVTTASVIRASADWNAKPRRRSDGVGANSFGKHSPAAAIETVPFSRGRRRVGVHSDELCSGRLDAAAECFALPETMSRTVRPSRGRISEESSYSTWRINDLAQHGLDAAFGPSASEIMGQPTFIVLPRRHLNNLHGLHQHRSLTENLIDSEDQIGYVKIGLEDDIVPKFAKRMTSAFESGGRCSICLEEFCDGGEEVGTLDCGHGYHVTCIQRWLLQKSTCPVCKAIVPLR